MALISFKSPPISWLLPHPAIPMNNTGYPYNTKCLDIVYIDTVSGKGTVTLYMGTIGSYSIVSTKDLHSTRTN